jgi:hypothetical protein
MPAMDGIKSAAKQANIHAPLVSSFAAFLCKRYTTARLVKHDRAECTPIVPSIIVLKAQPESEKKTATTGIWNELL